LGIRIARSAPHVGLRPEEPRRCGLGWGVRSGVREGKALLSPPLSLSRGRADRRDGRGAFCNCRAAHEERRMTRAARRARDCASDSSASASRQLGTSHPQSDRQPQSISRSREVAVSGIGTRRSW
jgi:hypothetical protein